VGLVSGLGLRATRVPRDMCRGIPGHKSLRPKLYVEPPLGERRGLPGLLAHRPRDTRAIPHRGLWGGPEQGGCPETSTLRCRGLPGRQPIHGCGLPGPCVGVWMPSGNDDMPKVRRQTMISKASYNWRKHLQTTPLSASWHIITTATPTLQITSWEGFIRPETGPPPPPS
jgi:hypothetical protein